MIFSFVGFFSLLADDWARRFRVARTTGASGGPYASSRDRNHLPKGCSMTDVLDILVKARAEVEAGWCKNALEDDDGNVCALGALNRAELGNALSHGTTGPYRPLKAAIGLNVRYVSDWNNAASTTKEDVLAAFDRAINAEAARLAPVADPAHVHSTVA